MESSEVKPGMIRAVQKTAKATMWPPLLFDVIRRNLPRRGHHSTAFGSVLLMFDGGKRFTPSMLSFLESKSEASDFIQGCQTHNSVNEPADNRCFTEDGGNKVESEKTYQPPVEGTDKK
jgi:hypothetical protein